MAGATGLAITRAVVTRPLYLFVNLLSPYHPEPTCSTGLCLRNMNSVPPPGAGGDAAVFYLQQWNLPDPTSHTRE